MSITSKIKTFFWFLARPSYYGQLLSLIRSTIWRNPGEDTRKESEAWCESQAIDNSTFLKEHLGINEIDVSQLFQDIFIKAHNMADAAPVKMGGPGNINLIYTLCEYLKAEKVIETGVAYGWSTLALLLSLQKRTQSLLISIDLPYAKMSNEDYVGCVIPANLKSNWELVRQPDRKALPKALSEVQPLDMCHYDSDKTYAGRMWAYPKIWEKIRKGGFFISDDIGDNIAFREFCKKNSLVPIVIKLNNQFVGVLQKP